MNHSGRMRPIPDEQRILGSYELQLRNLVGVQRHAQPIVERLQGRRGFADPTSEVLSHMYSCDLDAQIAAVAALRSVWRAEDG
jgi:hypothetical protein